MEQELYALPEGWEWKKLGDLCQLENGDRGKNYPSRSSFIDSGIPVINAGNLNSNGIDLSSLNYISRKRFDLLGGGKIREGDILFCLRGSLGKSAIVKGISEGAIASSLVIVRPNHQLTNVFLQAYFNSDLCAKMIEQYDNGAAQPNLSSRNLKKFLLPTPPLNEQKRIVARLDALFTRIDTAISHLQETLELSKALFASALEVTFIPTGNIEAPPDGWSCEILQTVSNLITDGTHHSPKEQFASKGKDLFMYITSKHVKFDGLKLKDITYIKKEVHDEIYRRCNPEYLDQLITKDGAMTGTCCLNTLKEPFSLLSSVALVKLKRDKILPYFLNYYLQSPTGQKLMLGDISGAAITRTNLKKLKSLRVPLPHLKEQERIVQHIETLSKHTRTLEAATEEKIKNLTALKASLLNQAFRGKL